MGIVLGPLVWALVAGYWLWLRPRWTARYPTPGRPGWPRRLLAVVEVCVSLLLVGFGGWLAADSFATPTP
ncbi:MAG: hypothetical protein L0Y54_05800 [Sporichthyaceae bacterium]|nr:hypothetical protein [Sporichthyaceae bacterium]